MTWGEIDRDEWEALAALAPLQQTWRWGDLLAMAGARLERRAARDAGGRAVALAQVATRRRGPLAISLLSRGPVCLDPATPPPGRLSRSLARCGGRLLLVTPERGTVPGAVPVVTPAWHAELDLAPAPDDLRRRLGQKMRNAVSRAEREGVDVRRDDRTPARYAWLLDAEAAQQRERRYRNWPPGMVDAWRDRGGAVRVFAARRGGAPLAAMLFLLHGRVATYHIGWAGQEGRRVAAHPLCLWRAILELRAEGIARIDLGTVDTEAAPGLARFKIASGAAIRPLGATFLVPPWA